MATVYPKNLCTRVPHRRAYVFLLTILLPRAEVPFSALRLRYQRVTLVNCLYCPSD